MNRYFLYVLLLALCVTSCSDNAVYDNYKTLPGNWAKDQAISFSIKDIDTIDAYNAFINLRNTSDYKYRNLFLITELAFPNGKLVRDTLEYEMAFANGEYMGEGFGDIKENKLWYKENLSFPEFGTYTFTIKQAMRENGSVNGIENLKGITEIGFRLEPTQD